MGHDEDPPPNVILTGFMGTGKSTVGRILARRLGREWVDTDDLIEARHGPIPEIFARQGEAAFRDLERQVAEELSRRGGLVISTGGRLLLDDENARLLGEGGVVFCLEAAPETIATRLSRTVSGTRPLLDAADVQGSIGELLAERREGYARFRRVITDGRSAEQVADDLVVALQAGDPEGGPVER